MITATMKHADKNASCSFGGQSFQPDEKGHVTVPVDAVEHLTSCGFTVVGAEDEEFKAQSEADHAKAEAEKAAAAAAAKDEAEKAAAAAAAEKPTADSKGKPKG